MIQDVKKIYLCTPNLVPTTVLNGIDTSSVDYETHLKDYSELHFDVSRYITVNGVEVESNGYEDLKVMMYLYLEDIGYFQMQEPETINDGNYEHKEITAYSIEKEFEQKDWLGLKINTADPDSLEQLAPGNLNDMGFAIEFVSFYNPQKPALSFVDLMLTKMPGWSIGHIDRNLWYATVPRIDVSNSNLYAIMTNEVAPRMSCVFVFDFLNKQVNAYHQSSLEFDTNIFVGFRNLAQEVEISVDEDSVFTEFRVRGDNDLSTRNANFGSDQVFDLSYFASKPWMSDATVQKYKQWLQNREAKRPEYITLAREAAKINEQLFEVRYRVPSDDTYWKNWDNMNEEGLQENLKYYKAQLELLQVSVDTRPDSQKYDSQGNYTPKYLVNDEVDHDWYMNLLHESANGYGGYYTYQEIIWYIIPYIETAIYNLNKPSDQKIKYGDASAENWSLYGYIELEAKLKNYQEDKLPALDKYKLPWSQLTDEQKTNYVDESGYMAAGRSEYEHVVAMIGSESREGTIKYYLKKLGDEIESFEKQLKQVESQMESIADYVDLDGGSNSFSKDEQKLISTLLVDTDYTNNNILTTSIDTVNTTIDHEIELYNDALEKLSEVAQPQYSFTVSLDNLLRIPMFSGWVEDLRLLRFIRLGIRDDYSVKLRVVGIKYNPCEVTPDLELEFSSMITSKSGRNDFTDILNNAGNRGSKNGISVGTGNSSTEVEYLTSMLTLMSKNGLLNGIIGTVGGGSALDTTAVNGLISRYMSSNMIPVNMLSGDFSLILNKLTAEEITTKLLNADEAHFDEVIAKYLEATTIISKTIAAESGDFEKLSTQILNAGDIFASKLAAATISVDQLTGHSASFEKLVSEHITADTIKAGVATIDALSADSAFFQYLQSLNSTAVNSIVTDSYIQNAIVNKLRVADLKAGDITLSDSMRILSENGQLVMNGTALQILGKDKDDKPYVGVQLGYDTTQNPSLILRNEDGEVVLTPQGITGEAIADQLIRTDMIHDGDITKEKLSFDVWSKDDRITIQNLYTETGDQFGTEWTNFTNKIDRIDRTAVTATTFYYYSSTSRDNPTGGTWTTDTSQLDYSAGRYIWQKEQITYANGDVEETDPVMITGNDGMQGASSYIHVKYSPVANPSDAQITDVEDTYIGICVNESPSDPTTASSYTWSKLVGTDGQPGGKGADGKDSYVHFAYATSADGTENFNVNNFEGATYLGVYTDDTLADKTSPSYYAWTLIKGADGKDGKDGKDGIPGVSSYFHVKYASSLDEQTGYPTTMTDVPSKYIGTYVDTEEDDSTDPTKYAWTQFEGTGVPGTNGKDGKTSYVHIRYSNDGGTTFTGNSGKNPGDYIGQYVDFTEADSTDVSKYTWTKIKGQDGIQGPKGEDGDATYFHVKYAPSLQSSGYPTASDMTESISTYIGTYVDQTKQDSTDPLKYSWIKLEGTDGIAGINGTDGKTSYLHIKYSNDNGATFTGNSGEDVGDYIGQYVDFTQADSTKVGDYTWSQIKGERGEKGIAGDTSYFHVKYASALQDNGYPAAGDMTDTPNTYIGTYVDFTKASSTVPSKYTWSKFEGTDGQPGTNGTNGQTSYLHIKYSDDGKTFTANSGETPGAYIGQYVDFTQADSTTFSKYTWTKIKGNDGTDGIGISDVIEYYQISSSGTTAPTSWTKTIPLMTETDRYLWNYEEIQYDDSPTHIATTTPRVIGVYGESGEEGRGISHITREYLASNKSTGVTRNGDSGWTTEVQSPTASKRFLWAYETRSYTSGDPDYDGPFIIGTYAESGADGRGVKNVKNYYLASTLDSGVTRSTSGWKETVQTMTATNKYLWNYEEVIYTSGNPDYTEPTIIGFYSKEGADGKGISSITEYYARSTGTAEDTIMETFTPTVKTVDATNKYLWNYELITYTDNSTSETTKRIIGMYSKDGSNGRGISNIKPYYLATSASSGVTRTTAGWEDTIQTMTATDKYLWSYDIISYTTGNPSYTDPHIVGVYGDKGDQGPAGKGIASIVNHYLASSSTTAPAKTDSKWTTTVQAIDATNRYLWNYETVNYTSGNPTETDPVIIGVYGQKGDQGIQGPKGDNGRGVTGIKQLYYLSTSGTQSSLPTPPTGWSESAPAWEKNKYLWMCTEITYNLAPLKEYTTPYYDEGWLAAGEVYSELSSTISGVKSVADNAALNITNKVWQSDVKTAIKNLNIGGENLYDPSQIKSYKDGALNNATNITVSGNTINVNGNPNTYPGFKVDVSGVTEVGNNKLLIVDGYYQYQTNTGADTNEFKNVVIAYRPFNQSGTALQAQATTPAVFDGATTRFTALLTIPKAANYVNIGIGQSYSKPYMLNAVTVKDSSLYDATTTIRDRLSQQIIDLDGVHTEVADIQSDINDGTLMSKLAKQNFTADGVTTSVAAMNTTLGSTSSLATQTSNKFSWIVSGGTSSSNMTLTSDFYNLVAENINLTGKVSFNSLDANTKSMLQPGLMMKVNYSAYSTVDDGEVYLHGYTDGVPADVDGYVWWNNKKITVPKKMINPNAICPYYTTLYIVLRLTSASSTGGTLYIVWYNNGWKYCITPTPSKVESSAWTWSEERDVVIGQFIETASEGPVIDAYLYNPPRKGTEVQTKNAKNPYQYSSNAVSWVDSNSAEHANAITMLKKWSYNGAISATTTINGGLIQTNTILADAIAVDQLSAITANIGTVTAGILKSSDYAYTSGVFADKGIMLSLTDKLLRAVNFAIDASGNAYFKGTVKTSNVTIADANGKALASYGSSIKFYLPGTTTVATEFSNDGLVMSKGSININDRFMVNKDGGTTISYKQTDTTSSDILTVQRINSDQTVTKYIYLNDNGDLVINGNSVMIGSSSLTTAINDAVKGVSVGGRNLLLDTDAPSLTKVSSDYHRYFSDASVTMITPTYIEVTDAPINCHYGSRYNVTATSAVGRRVCWYNGGVVPMESGKEYTISVYARLTSGTAGSISFEYGVSPYASQNIQITNKKWERYSWTFTYDSTYGANGTRIYIGAFASNVCTLELCGYQLEKGNVATDWQVAPEDMEQRITKNTTAITTNSNQIKLMATKDEVSQQISKINVGGTNLLENSSFSTDLEKWDTTGTGQSIVTQDGYKCGHVAGALKADKYIEQNILPKIKSDDFTTQKYTVSADIKLVNYVAGTTNPYVALYFSGNYDNNGTSAWMGATYTSTHLLGPYNNLGWVRVSFSLSFQHTPTSMGFKIYARDFTGDLYFKNLKLERGDHATDWSPAPEDATGLIGALTTRMETAEAQISVQAGEIELRAKSSEVAEVVPGINLSPFFSHDITDKYNASSNPTGYWTRIDESSPFTFTQLADGWIHVKINNASGTGLIRSDWSCAADDVILPSTDYTFLFEFRNRVSTATGTGDNYIVQGGGGCQFWNWNIKKNLEGTGTDSTTVLSSIPTDGSIYRKRFVKTSEAQNSSNRTANPKHMVVLVFRASAGEVIEFEYRASIYKGEYLGPYAPYVLSDDTNIKTMAANAQTTADGAASGVASLVTRVTDAETSISNNSKEIALRATMTQVNTAKSDAISQAGTATDNKLKSYSTTDQMNSAIVAKANEITTSVSNTYATQQTVTNLSTTVTQNHNSVTTAISNGDETTMSRVYNNGVLVGKVGQSVCALVNANGSFQIVPVTWSGSTPTVGTAYASFGATSKIGTSTIATASDISTLQNNLPDLVSNEVSKVEIGGQNLFRNSGNMTAAQWAIGSSGTVTDGILQLAPTTSVAYAKQKINYLDYAEYKDSKLTLSFDARYVSGNSSYTAPDHISLYYGVNLASRYRNSSFSSNYDRYAITNSINPTSTWARYKFTFDLKQTTLTSGSQSALAAGNYITFEFDVAGSRWPVQFRKIKLERGSVATDWSPAPGEESAGYYATCSTSGSTQQKEGICPNFVLTQGATIHIKFNYKNTASNPTLNVNGTGAKQIYINGQPMTSSFCPWNASETVTMTYDGSYWQVVGQMNLNADNITAGTLSAVVINAKDQSNLGGWIVNKATTDSESSLRSDMVSLSGYKYQVALKATADSNYGCIFIKTQDSSGGTTRYPFWVKPDGSMLSTNPELLWYLGSAAARTSNTKNVRLRRTSSGGICFAEYSTDSTSSSSIIGTLVSDSGEFLPTTLVTPTVVDTSCTITANHSFVFGSVLFINIWVTTKISIQATLQQSLLRLPSAYRLSGTIPLLGSVYSKDYKIDVLYGPYEHNNTTETGHIMVESRTTIPTSTSIFIYGYFPI